MTELTLEEIKKEFKVLKQEYKSNADHKNMVHLFTSASKLFLALTDIGLSDNNYKDTEIMSLLSQIDRFCDVSFNEMTGTTVRLFESITSRTI